MSWGYIAFADQEADTGEVRGFTQGHTRGELDQKALALKLCSNHQTSGQRKMGRSRSKPEVSSAQDYK